MRKRRKHLTDDAGDDVIGFSSSDEDDFVEVGIPSQVAEEELFAFVNREE
jgi:hypothetical protein